MVGLEHLERPCVHALVGLLCFTDIGERMPDEPAVDNFQTP
jgi:hypothetical protein